MEWTASLTLKFIQEYKTRSYLWQAIHPEYKNYALRTNGYKQIADVFGCEVRDVKKKINSLNSSFRRERRNILKIQDYQPTWFAYPRLKFLYEKFGKSDGEGDMDEEHLDDSSLYDGEQTNDSITHKTSDPTISKMEWTNSLTLKLIDGYGARPCLWRPKDTNFKNQYQRVEAWKQLAAMFSCEVHEIKKKISTLLTSFRRERREILNYEQQTGEAYEPTWFAFNSMKFLFERYPKEENEIETERLNEEYLLTSLLNQSESQNGVDIGLTSNIKFESDPLTAKENQQQLKRKYEISTEVLNEATLPKKPSYTMNENLDEQEILDEILDDEDANWTNNQTLKLIEAYKNRACIWQPTNADYRNAVIKSQAWKELAKLFNCEVIDVKKKMNSLLTSFRRERREIHNYKLKTGKKLISSWFAFNSMKFLYAKFTRNTTADEEVHEENGQMDYQYTAAKSEPQEEDFLNQIPQDVIDPLAVRDNQTKQTATTTVTTQSEDPRINEVYSLLKVAFNRTNDDSATYGEHVAWKLRQYSQKVRNTVQHHINNILYDADMGKFETDQEELLTLDDEVENYSENESTMFNLKPPKSNMKLRQNKK